MREKESGDRYTPTSCFENFPLPKASPAVAAAARELNNLRERWLNPPEWTRTDVWEFPGTVGGPWARFIDSKTVNAKTGVGMVRYPMSGPLDASAEGELKARTLTGLYNSHPAWLVNAHKNLDNAVAAAYGWGSDIGDDEILTKLLQLNSAGKSEI